ncbi:MAG: CdaR family protein [Anaerolineae bacterium]
MKGVLRWIVSNLGLMALSLILAALVWVVAVEQDNPTSEERYRTPIPIEFTGLPEGMVFYAPSHEQAYVTVRAPESVWDILRAEDFRAVVDLSGLQAGEHRLEVDASIAQEPAMVRRVEPELVTVYMEPIAEGEVPVAVEVEGSAALGFIARQPEVTPITVTIRGPASHVDQVTEGVASVSISGARADLEGEFALEPVDDSGERVSYVTLSPSKVAVRVPVDQLRGFRDLTVRVPLEGTVAQGYRISNIMVDPPVVTVSGRQDAIDQIPGFLETVPLSVEGAWENVEAEMPLVVNEGVSLIGMEEPTVNVTVFVVPEQGSVTVDREITLQGWTPGITVTVAPTAVQVILSGPLPVLDQLQQGDVLAVIDLFGLTAGTYSIEPRVVVVPQEILVDSVVPASVQVEIKQVDLTPTPEGE